MLIKKILGLSLLLIFSVGSLAFAGTPKTIIAAGMIATGWKAAVIQIAATRAGGIAIVAVTDVIGAETATCRDDIPKPEQPEQNKRG